MCSVVKQAFLDYQPVYVRSGSSLRLVPIGSFVHACYTRVSRNKPDNVVSTNLFNQARSQRFHPTSIVYCIGIFQIATHGRDIAGVEDFQHGQARVFCSYQLYPFPFSHSHMLRPLVLLNRVRYIEDTNASLIMTHQSSLHTLFVVPVATSRPVPSRQTQNHTTRSTPPRTSQQA